MYISDGVSAKSRNDTLIIWNVEVTDVGIADNISNAFSLHQNYPNPFNPTTTISYTLPRESNVDLFIYNANGQIIKRYAVGIEKAGKHIILFDATGMNSGIYFYVIKAGGNVQIRKMLLLK